MRQPKAWRDWPDHKGLTCVGTRATPAHMGSAGQTAGGLETAKGHSRSPAATVGPEVARPNYVRHPEEATRAKPRITRPKARPKVAKTARETPHPHWRPEPCLLAAGGLPGRLPATSPPEARRREVASARAGAPQQDRDPRTASTHPQPRTGARRPKREPFKPTWARLARPLGGLNPPKGTIAPPLRLWGQKRPGRTMSDPP